MKVIIGHTQVLSELLEMWSTAGQGYRKCSISMVKHLGMAALASPMAMQP